VPPSSGCSDCGTFGSVPTPGRILHGASKSHLSVLRVDMTLSLTGLARAAGPLPLLQSHSPRAPVTRMHPFWSGTSRSLPAHVPCKSMPLGPVRWLSLCWSSSAGVSPLAWPLSSQHSTSGPLQCRMATHPCCMRGHGVSFALSHCMQWQRVGHPFITSRGWYHPALPPRSSPGLPIGLQAGSCISWLTLLLPASFLKSGSLLLSPPPLPFCGWRWPSPVKLSFSSSPR
jgi:hypothetical protein